MLPDGIVVVVKRSCPTCQLVTGVLDRLERGPAPLTVYSQDDTDFRPGTRDDTELEISFAYDIDTVPTVLRVEGGEVVGRTEGWRRDRWEEITGAHPLGTDLPEWRPGCGSRTHDPDVQDALTIARTRTVDAGTPYRARLRTRTTPRRCSHAGGATGCRSCHPRSNASRACWPRHRAIRKTSSP